MAKRTKRKPPLNPSGRDRDRLWGPALLLAVLLVYLPVGWAGYVWDDDQVFTANPVVVGPLGLAEIWTTTAADICPLTLSTFWFEHKMWGLAPFPYHLVTVLLHAGCALVLWHVLRSLRVAGAWLGAALWALHPVMVESVAWISEMKNTESGLFFLLSILFFTQSLHVVDGRKSPDAPHGVSGGPDNSLSGCASAASRAHRSSPENHVPWAHPYLLSLLFAALAMAAKSSTVVLPVILGLCAWWFEKRWNRRTAIRIIPVFLMAVTDSAFTIWRQGLYLSGPTDQWLNRPWLERLATAGDAIWFYLSKLLWPHPLIAVYPRWEIAAAWYDVLPLLAATLVLGLCWFNRRSWSRAWFFAFACFIVALLPVLGFINNTYDRLSFVADHFQYLAAMAPLALVGAGIARLSTYFPGKAQAFPIIGAALLLILGTCTWQRAWLFENEDTLWVDTLAQNPACWVGHNNYGNSLVQRGLLDEGLAHLQTALELNPNFGAAHVSLGSALLKKGQPADAIAHFQKALELNPDFTNAQYDLAVALVQEGHIPEAIPYFQRAVELDPTFADAHYDLGAALGHEGQSDAAIAQFRKAIALDPDLAEAHNNLGVYLARSGHLDEAAAQFGEALRARPDYPEAQMNLARVQAALQQNGGQK